MARPRSLRRFFDRGRGGEREGAHRRQRRGLGVFEDSEIMRNPMRRKGVGRARCTERLVVRVCVHALTLPPPLCSLVAPLRRPPLCAAGQRCLQTSANSLRWLSWQQRVRMAAAAKSRSDIKI
jgi:hypothetical protein